MGAFTSNGGSPLTQINEFFGNDNKDEVPYSESDISKLKKAFKKYKGNFDTFSQFTFKNGKDYISIKSTPKGIKVSGKKISIKSKSVDDAIKKLKKKLK